MRIFNCLVIILLAVFIENCKSINEDDHLQHIEKNSTETSINTKPKDQIFKILKKIDIDKVRENVKILSSDSLLGRYTGHLGQKKAAKFLKDYYINLNIKSPDTLDYYQVIEESYFKSKAKGNSENVLAFIEGTSKKEEVIVLCAHYDHLGISKENEIYRGADDNGSGTAVLLELARIVKQAKDKAIGPKRSILFLHVTGEELGLYGSKFYVENPVFSLKNTVANINIDMVGRVDDRHSIHTNYVYVVGSNRISPDLHNINTYMNENYVGLSLDYKYDQFNDPLRIYYRSDHYNFAKNGIPIIFYFSGLHEDYHKPTDTYEKLNYEVLKKRIELVFLTTWEIANRPNRLKIDTLRKNTSPKKRVLWYRTQ